jgi:hypothetical protein
MWQRCRLLKMDKGSCDRGDVLRDGVEHRKLRLTGQIKVVEEGRKRGRRLRRLLGYMVAILPHSCLFTTIQHVRLH